MSELAGNLTSPMWIGDRICFLGDGEGVGNLYSCRPDGSDAAPPHRPRGLLRAPRADRRPAHRLPVRRARSGCSTRRATATARSTIRTPAHRTQAARKFVAAGEHLAAFRLHPAGHSLAVDARGQLFGMRALGRRARASYAGADGGRMRHGQWLGRRQHAGRGERRLGRGARGQRSRPRRRDASLPLGHRPRHRDARRAAAARCVAIANHRNEVLDRRRRQRRARRASTRSDARPHRRPRLVARRRLARLHLLRPSTAPRARSSCYERRGAARARSSREPEFRDYSPVVRPRGQVPLLPVAAHLRPGLRQRPVRAELPARGAALPDRAAGRRRGRRSSRDPKGLKAERRARRGGRRADGRRAAAPIRVDLDGIARRVAAFPVPREPLRPDRRRRRPQGACGRVLPIVGAHGRGGHKEAAGRLELFDFATRAPRRWPTRSTRFELAQDGTTLVVRDGKRLRAIAADTQARQARARRRTTDTPSRKSGWIDLEPHAHLGRAARASGGRCCARSGACSATSSGRPTCRASTGRRSTRATRRCSTRVATRGELSDLIWEMQGELGTSHAYEMGGDHRKPPAVALGHLGADLALRRRGRQATRSRASSRGDPWDAGADSPLNAVGVEAQVGERIVAVNGQPVSRGAAAAGAARPPGRRQGAS